MFCVYAITQRRGAIMNNCQYDISVIVLTYNPDPEKLLMTLESILVQENVKFQIVVSDDGSDNNRYDDIKRYFEYRGFDDYILVDNECNVGTAKNLLKAAKCCEAEYIKDISPGDMLASQDVLCNWLAYMKSQGATLCMSDVICYNRDDSGQFNAVARRAYPQCVKAYKDINTLKEFYLLYNDLCVGAANMYKKDTLIYYLEIIKDKVIYAEDNSFRIMILKEEKVSFYEFNTALYESDSGISTSGNDVWRQRLLKDWKAANSIMKQMCDPSKKFDRKLPLILDMYDVKVSVFRKIYVYLRMGTSIRHQIWLKLTKRYTSTDMPVEYIDQLVNTYQLFINSNNV